MSTPSTLVADRYRLVAMLGAGGMGVVWHAWDERLHRDVALKMLRTQPELTDTERQRATDRAMREARITAGLHHPHAVTVFDVVEHEGQPCIVMQLIESTPLSALLREHGTLTPSETARIGAQVSSALAAAHKLRIVHRDVKPGNILITEDGSAMISDFGISHALGDATITATGMMHGTPAYLAPEVARGLPTSFASDVFSLGSTLYTMLEGEPPFGSDKNAIALLHRVAGGEYPPPEHAGPLVPLLRTMLAADPKQRPSMGSVHQSLSALHDGMRTTTAAVAVAAPIAPEGPGDAGEAEQADDIATERLHPSTVPSTIPLQDADDGFDPSAGSSTTVTQPAARQPETTEVLAAPVPPANGPATDDRPRKPRRRAIVLVGILVLVGALALGAGLLSSLLQSNADNSAEPRTGSAPTASSSSESPSSGTPSPSPSLPPAVQAPTPTPTPTTTEPSTPDQQAVDTVAGYYAMLPDDVDAAWPLMTADYQENHAGGRSAYEAFWNGIADVEVAEVSASAPDQAQATLTYRFRDGRTVQEVTAYRLADEGGVLKIAATDVLSSRQIE